MAMSAVRLVAGVESTPVSKDATPSVLRTGNRVVLQSPSFSFYLDITDGLHAELWVNKITGRKLVMGHGSEVGFDIGLPGQPLTTPHLSVTKAPAEGRTAGGEAVFELTSREPMAVVTVTYRWDAKRQVLHKQAVIRNTGTSIWKRLLDVRLGSYATDAAPFSDPDWPVRVTKIPWMCAEPDLWADPAGRERGYPAYPENQFFAGLAHPSGFALLQDRQLLLSQHPGVLLEPAKEFICMEAVYGVTASGGARPAFRDYLYSRMRIEMASLATTPALYARSSNVRLMDQTRRMVKDLPALGWDSLGVSLSRWAWNNRLGAEGWQESVLMDMCRGSLLTHIWSDPDCFPVADRPQMAEFIALLKARPECFVRPRFIGDARKDAVWGYSCSDGSRAMIALNNGSWHDQVVPLELNSLWGLPDKGQWDVYGWYPNHVRFTTGNGKPFGSKASIVLRPFTQVLLEVVPAGGKPALARSWERLPMPNSLAEGSSDVAVTASVVDKTNPLLWTIRGELPPCKAGGWFAGGSFRVRATVCAGHYGGIAQKCRA